MCTWKGVLLIFCNWRWLLTLLSFAGVIYFLGHLLIRKGSKLIHD